MAHLRSVRPFLVAAALLGSSLLPAQVSASSLPAVSIDASAKLHPLLQYGAKADPTRVVRVIVQKTRGDIAASKIAGLLSGLQVSEEFKYVPAFAASVPQALLPLVAASPDVRYITPDAPVQVIPSSLPLLKKPAPKPPAPKPVAPPKTGFDAASLLTVYPLVSGATQAWSGAATPDNHPDSGAKITVAVIDSGVDSTLSDLAGQVLAVNVNHNASSGGDGYGHGTHVAAIINGHDSSGQYYGIAPSTTVISVKIADDQGNANESDLLRGIDWVGANRAAYHIQAANLSVSSGIPMGYAVSPVDAAVEHLWKDNVTVIAAAGNFGSAQDAVWYAPGNDPYVITVGCVDDNESPQISDDSLCPISSRGVTEDGFAKPDLVASGRKVESALSRGVDGQGSVLASEFKDRITADGRHIRLSGTSMSAPVVTGAVALLLSRNTGLQPSQIRQLLLDSTVKYPGQPDRAGELNIAAALADVMHPPAPTRFQPLPVSGAAPASTSSTVLWDGSRWANAYFDGSRWASTYLDGSRWAGATWDGSRWASTYWDGSRWANAYFDGSRWAGSTWDGSRWAGATWDGSRWAGATWDGSRWASASFDGSRWANAYWD